MNNFGVIEIASTTTKSTPGWAYVPDTAPALPAAVHSTSRKRAARNQPALTLSDLSAREETRIRKELEALDRDNPKDVNIPIPPRPGEAAEVRPPKFADGGSRGLTTQFAAQNKHTPNVRKILQSQKSFANHLDDYQAMLALAESNPAAAAALNAAQAKPSTPTTSVSKSASPAPTPASAGGPSKRSAAAAKRAAAKEKQEQERKKAQHTPKPETESEKLGSTPPQQAPQQQQEGDNDVEMPDATASTTPQPPPTAAAAQTSYPRVSAILPAYAKPPPAAHPGDADPLLVSRVPPFPTDDELRALMTAPPLSYLEARGAWGEEERRYPVRVFCAVCGYWGRVKCMKCGTRVCALDCLEAHREECVTRYGL
ncbi:99367357-91bf-48ef-89ce-04b1f7aaf9a0 [Thermothielavioides terrestris]|uniref:99367357-91bf-48ef-89ce-04b1f7aaf9a0 n=1 Tax=Thermothielavioides terrestris TaxID=2587410 RepID=A0A446B880_9PEZI|nr:99367357-91bf-48ef-89ce-04b1f7aaf9a0 [Thermothielavioides terrestris]